MGEIVITKGSNGGYVVICEGISNYSNNLNYRTGTDLEIYDSIGKLIGKYPPQAFTVYVEGEPVTGFTTFSGVCDQLDLIMVTNSGTIPVPTNTGFVKFALTPIDGDFEEVIVEGEPVQQRVGNIKSFVLPEEADLSKAIICFDGLSFVVEASKTNLTKTVTFINAPFENSYIFYQL